MTKTDNVHSEIMRFLQSETPEVLCITGRWGVGKTFAWKRFVEEAQTRGAIVLERYAYISLFGQNSMNDLKATIFEETVKVGEIGKPFSFKSTTSSFAAATSFFPKIVAQLGSFIPGIKDYFANAGRLLFLTVRNQIICIDDLERTGTGLEPKDVLGLISFLKEERQCKMVLLLNEEQLEEKDRKEFQQLLEKVVDTRLEFSPTPAEAAKIAINPNTNFSESLIKNCIALGITNIRVIRKIEGLADRLASILVGFHPGIIKQAVHSVTLFGWAMFQPDRAPSITFLTDYDPWFGVLSDKRKEEEPANKRAWRALLKSY